MLGVGAVTELPDKPIGPDDEMLLLSIVRLSTVMELAEMLPLAVILPFSVEVPFTVISPVMVPPDKGIFWSRAVLVSYSDGTLDSDSGDSQELTISTFPFISCHSYVLAPVDTQIYSFPFV